MVTEYDFTTLEDYDRSQFEIEDKKLIKFIGDYKRVKVPKGVKAIMTKAFEGSDITELYIPISVQRVAPTAFRGCDKITKVELPLVLAKDVATLTKFFGENVARIDFSFALGTPTDFDNLAKMREELGKIHIESDGDKIVDGIDFGKEDPMLRDVIKRIAQTGIASASVIQRNFKTGYARASAMLDFLEEKGIIGPQVGAKPREVYITEDSYNAKFEEELFGRDNGVGEKAKSGTLQTDTSYIGTDEPFELLKDALRTFIEKGSANCVTLQRKFSMGYNRAMRILQYFEEQKFITPDLGGGKRDVIITKEHFEKMYGETE